jgi:hypothetical protein
MKKLVSAIGYLFLIFNSSCSDNDRSGYNCEGGNCVATYENPQYLTLEDCQSTCGNYISGFNCENGTCVQVTDGTTPQFSTLLDCQNTCEVEITGFNCVNGSCVQVTNGTTPQFSTLQSCQNSCSSGGSNVTPGYNCVNGNCSFVSDNAQYSSLYNCQNSCGNVAGGRVNLTASWTTQFGAGWPVCDPAFSVIIGIGYSSADIANEAYFNQSASTGISPTEHTVYNLTPGIYYYRAKKTFNANACGTGQGIPPVVIRSGSFTIVSGQTTNVNIGSLN